MALLTSITALTPSTTTTNALYVSDGAEALGFPQLGVNSSVVFQVIFDAPVSTVDPTDFTLNADAIVAGGAIEVVVAVNTTTFNVQVVGLGNFDGELTLSISPNQSITGFTGTSPSFTNETFLLETTQPGISSILRVSDLSGTPVNDPNVNNSSVLFQVKFSEAVRNVDISDFVPVGSAVISGVSVTSFAIATNAIRFTDVNGVTYADTYVYTVSGLDGLSGNLGLALSQGVNGVRDVDGASLITTAPPQGQDLDQTYTINNPSTTTFVSVVASDADAREESTDIDVISDNFPDSQVPSPLPYSIATTALSDDGRTIQIQATDSQGNPVDIVNPDGTDPDPADFQITAVLPRPVVSDGQVLGTGVVLNTVEALGESYLVTLTGLRNYTGTPTIRLSGTQDLQPTSGDIFQVSFGGATRNAANADIGGVDANGNTITSIVDINGNPVQVSVGSLDGTTDSVNIRITFNRDMLNVDSTDFDVVLSSLNVIATGLTINSVSPVGIGTGLYDLGITEPSFGANTFDGTARVNLASSTDLVPSGNPTSQDTGTFTLTRTGILSSSLTVRFRLDNVGNTQDSDYQVSGNNLTLIDAATNTYTVDIPALATETIVTITPNNDLALETTEIVRLVVEGTANYSPQTSAQQASVFITDNLSTQAEDLTIPRITIQATDPIADEETGESARFVINIEGNDDAAANPDGLAISIVAGGSAVIGEDYVIEDADGIRFSDLATFIISNLTGLAVGVTQVEFLVIPNRDFVAGNRTVTFTIQSSSQNLFIGDQADYTVGTPFVAGATILDVDAPIAIPDVSIVASDPVGSEANKDTITFTLTRTTASTGPVTVFLQVGGDATAFEGELPPPSDQLLPEGTDYITDYQVTAGLIAVTFNEGETVKTITVTPIDDLDLDNGFTDEVISLSILPSAFYTISDSATATGVIVNDEEPAIVIIDPSTEVSEGGLRTFTVRIDGNAIGQDLRITFNVGGSATNPNLLADANGSTDTGADAGDDYYIPDLLVELGENLLGDPVVITTAPTVIIPAGSTSATFTVQTIDDGLGLDDDSETVVINLTAGEGYVVGTQNESTLTIRDINDRGVVSLNVTDATAQESDSSVASYVLERSGDNLQEVFVTFDVSGTGTFGVTGSGDYSIAAYDLDNPSVNLLPAVPNPVVDGVLTLTLPPGSPLNTTAGDPQQIRIDIVPNNDTVRDNTTGVPETVTLTLQQSNQDPTRGPSRLYSLRDGETTGTVNIVDDDPLISPEITLDSVVDNLAEGSTTTITVRLVGGNIFGSEIPISFALGGTAVLGTDYTLTDASGVAVTNSIVFTSDDIRDTDGNGSIDAVFKNLTLTAISDGVGLNDDGETVIFSLTDGAGYTLTGTTSDTVILRDRSDRGTVTVAATDSVAAETDAATVDNLGTFTFTRTGDNLNTTLTVTFSLGGSATFTTDYTTAVTGAVSGGITTNSNGTFSFTFAALGTESGTQTATVTVTPVDDLLFETTTGFETIDLTLQDGGTSYSVVTGQTSATINLVDDEVALPPTITIVAVDAIAGETPVGTIANTGRFRIYRGVFLGDPNDAGDLADPANYANRGNTTDQDIVVTFTVAGTAGVNDYTTVGNTATIAAGEYFVDVVLSPIDDALANDNSETVTLTLVENAPTYLLGDTDAVPSTATVTILDNDGNAPTVSVAAVPGFADEQGTSSFFTLSRTQDDNPTAAITVNFTLSGIATPSTDYEVRDQNGTLVPLDANFRGTVTLGANIFATTLEIRPLTDATPEANETVTLTLNASPSYTLPTTGTSATTVIADSAVPPNDRVVPEVSVIALDPLASESPQATAAFLVTFAGNDANTNPDGNLEIALQLDGTATLGQDYFVTSPDLAEDNQPIVTGNIIRIQNIPTTVIGANGVNTVTLIITPFDDADAESLETVTLRVLPSTENENSANFADYTLAAPQDTVASVTIVDNDVLFLPTVSISATPTSIAENERDVAVRPLFTITRAGGTSLNDPLTVSYTISGSAVAGTDYDGLTGSVTIAAGQASATIEIAPLDDLDVEGTESVTLTLTDPVQGPPQYVFDNTQSSATIAITDNDTLPGSLPQVSVLTLGNGGSASEVNTADPNLFDRGQFTFILTGSNLPSEVTVNYTIGGTATAGTDYQAITNSITFTEADVDPANANRRLKTVDITAIDDLVYDFNETISVTIDSDSTYTIGSESSAVVTIVDNEIVPIVSISPTNIAGLTLDANGNYTGISISEASTPIEFTITREGPSGEALTVVFSTRGTATEFGDYDYNATVSTVDQRSVTIAAGETSATFVIDPIDDTIGRDDDSETVILSLVETGSYTIATAQNEVGLVILDNDDRGIFSLEILDAQASEVDPTDPTPPPSPDASFRLYRSETDDRRGVTVQLNIAGTAIASDYQLIDESTGATISLTQNQDGSFSAPVVFVDEEGFRDEDGTGGKFIRLVAVNDTDFDNILGPETVVITIDPLDAGSTQDYFVGDSDTGTITIVDNDPLILPQVRIAAAPLSVLEDERNSANRAVFTITRDGGSPGGISSPLTVSYTVGGSATEGTDYQTIGNSVTILAGETTATIEIAPLDDFDSAEGNETVTITLADPVGAPAQYTFGTSVTSTITITDDDDPLGLPQVTVIASPNTASEVSELVDGVSTRQRASFTFNRTSTQNDQLPLTVNFTVSGTATAGTDYENSLGTSITFAPGEFTKTIELTAIDDLIYDPNETVSLTIASDSNYIIGSTSSATATIVDNEVIPTISISASGTELIEGGAAITYTVTRVAGSSGSPITVNFALTGNAQRILDYNFTSGLVNPTSDSSITLAANQTTATFTIVAATNSIDLIDDGEIINLTLAESTNYLIPVFLTDNPLTIENEALQDNPATAGINESLSNIQALSSQVTLTIRDRSDTGNITLTSTDLLGGEERTGVDDSSTPQDESVNAIVFTLTRSGDNLQTISIPFTITGEASTADYTIDIYSYDANGVVTKVAENQESTIFNTSTGRITLPSFGTSPFDPVLTNGVLTPQIIELHFNPVDDTIIDSLGGVETLTLTLTEDSPNGTYTVGSALTTTQVSLTGSIQDNNDTVSILPIVEVVATDAEAFEGGVTSPNGVFTFSLKDSDGDAFTATEALTINFSVTGSTATPGSESTPQDYLSLGSSITIAAGSSTATLIVEPQDDNEAGESLETVKLTVDAGNYIQSTTLNSAVVTIADNEPPPFTPTVSVATQRTPAAENPVGTGIFRISRTLNGEESAAPFLENIAVTVGGNASVNTDYSFSLQTQGNVSVPISGTLSSVNIPATDSYIDVVVTPKSDTFVDPNETVTLTLSGGSSTTYLIDPDSPSASLTIQDANRVEGVTVSIELATGLTNGDSIDEESQATNAFIVRRFGGNDALRLDQALTVNLTIGGTATAGTDYASIPSTVVIPIGVDQVFIPVTPIGDTIADTGGDESVQISIAPIANNSYRVALDEEVDPALDTDVVNETLDPATVFIIDNENNAPELDASFLDSFSVVEDSAAVELTSPSDSNQTFAQLIQQAFTDEDTAIPENDNETLRSIRFVTLPASGRLTLNGAAITLNQVVEFATAAAISSVLANLRYQPNANFFGQSSDLVAQPDRFTVVANDGFANSRETPVIINVLPVNDAPSYILPGETGFVIDPDFVSDNRASLPNFALLPGSSVVLPNFVQGISVGPSNEGVSSENSPVPNGNQTPAFTVEPIIGDSYIFTSGGAPTIDALGTLRFTLRQDIDFGTAQVRISVKDNGGTANNGIDTLTKGFFIVTADANTLGNVITDFESTPGQTGGLIYNTTALPLGSAIRTRLTADVRQLGTSGSFDNIVGLYEIADPNGGIDLGRDLDGDGDIDTAAEQLAKDGIADITPNANMTAAERTTYARAALQSHVNDLSLFNLRAGSNGDAVRNTTSAQFNAQGQSTTGSQQGVVLEAGKLYAPFIIANGGTLISGNGGTIAGGVSSFITVVNPNNLDTNPNSVSDPVAYFSFSEVNPDRSEHLRSLGNNVYGFEDLPNGGDRDFNDAIFSFTFNTTVVA